MTIHRKVAHANFSSNGTFTLTNAQVGKTGDPTKDLSSLRHGRDAEHQESADIIVDLNSRLFEVDYNASNYNIAEMTAEKACSRM